MMRCNEVAASSKTGRSVTSARSHEDQDSHGKDAAEVQDAGVPESPTLESCFHIGMVANLLFQLGPAFPEQVFADMGARIVENAFILV